MSLETVPTLICFFGGAPAYLELALRSVADFRNEVVFLGDETNRHAWSAHWDCNRVLLPKFDAFLRGYEKMSDYPDFYEMSFWRRPFVVEEWMRREGVARAFLLDSDVLTFADYSREVTPALPPGCTAALMTFGEQESYDWATSLHFSYWTLPALESFTSFVIEAYRDKTLRGRLESKYQWHLQNGHTGGICEMTLLYLWRERHEKQTWNLAKVWNGMVGDLAVGTSANYLNGEYQMRRGLKRLTFDDNGVPHAYNMILATKVRFLCVHCQRHSKGVMRFFAGSKWRGFYAEAYHLQGLRSAVQAKAAAVLTAMSSARERLP